MARLEAELLPYVEDYLYDLRSEMENVWGDALEEDEEIDELEALDQVDFWEHAYTEGVSQLRRPLLAILLAALAFVGAEGVDPDSTVSRLLFDLLHPAGAHSIIATTRQGVLEGLGLEQIFPVHRAARIAVTETTRFFNAGLRLGRQSQGITEYRWYTAADDRVCWICAPMHGVRADFTGWYTLPTGERIQHPPAHPECRCWEE